MHAHNDQTSSVILVLVLT